MGEEQFRTQNLTRPNHRVRFRGVTRDLIPLVSLVNFSVSMHAEKPSRIQTASTRHLIAIKIANRSQWNGAIGNAFPSDKQNRILRFTLVPITSH